VIRRFRPALVPLAALLGACGAQAQWRDTPVIRPRIFA
jgi:hypothetical protein